MRHASGLLQTLRSINGVVYTFYEGADGRLEVRERCSEWPEEAELELLDGTPSGVESWAAELPTRLKRMLSHWCSWELGLILLRPRSFSNRSVQFLIYEAEAEHDQGVSEAGSDSDNGAGGAQHVDISEGDGAGMSNMVCLRVPEHLQLEMEQRILDAPATPHADQGGMPAGWSWETVDPILSSLTADLDQLVLPQPPSIALVQLCKLETKAEFVHLLVTPRKTLLFELPRFNLSFELGADGALQSKNFRGHSLAPARLLTDAMHGFERYLVLAPTKASSGALRLLILPEGGIIAHSSGRISVQAFVAFDAPRRFYVFEVHPRLGSIEARGGPDAIATRLQLANIYLATSTQLPEERSKQTGGEVAMQLLPQSWKGHPHTPDERKQLRTVHGFSGRTPGASMLSYELDASARALSFLHRHSAKEPEPEPLPLCASACTEYEQRKREGRASPRSFLTSDVEVAVLGRDVGTRPAGRDFPAPGSLQLQCVSGRSNGRELEAVDRALQAMLSQREPAAAKPFPLSMEHLQVGEIGKCQLRVLKASWDQRQRTPSCSLARPAQQLIHEIRAHLALTRRDRASLEAAILSDVDRVPAGCHSRAPAFNMRRAANLEASVTLRDLTKAITEPGLLRLFNPFPSPAALEGLDTATLLWGQLCVAENKLERMCGYLTARDEVQVSDR
jgi:hypothetical protein